MNKIISLLYILLILNLSGSTLAQDWQGYIGPYEKLFQVQNIDVTGLARVGRQAILEKIDMKVGSIATNYSVRRDIDKLYSMGYFESVEIHQIISAGKKTLLIKLSEKPAIGKISYQGNDELDADDFKEKITIKPYAILDVSQLRKDTLELQKLYEEKGYFLAVVDYELVTKENESVVDVVFKIKEHSAVKVKEISFQGNKNISTAELKNNMMTQEKTLFSFMSGSGSFKQMFFQVDQERIKFLYQSKGFLNVALKKPLVSVSEDRKWIFIKFEIKEGEQFHLNDVSFSGDLLFSDAELKEKIKSKKNEPFNEDLVRSDLRALAEMYQDKGYAFANVNRNLKPSGANEKGDPKVDLDLHFEKGEIAYIGNINIHNNTNTRDKVIRRELLISEGQKYSGSKLRLSEAAVNRLGFFEPRSVVFKTTPVAGSKNVLDLDISVKERRTGQVSLGAGYSTANKGFFQASVSQNNFLGLGTNLNASLLFAGNNQTYNLGYTDPYFMDTNWLAGVDIFRIRSQRISSFDFRKTGGSLRTGYKLSNFSRFFLNYKLEQIKLENIYSPETKREVEEGYASSVQASITVDKRDNSFEPTDGTFYNFSSEFGGIGGDQDWLELDAEGRFYKPIGAGFIFRSRLKFSQLFEVGGQEISRHRLYSMGGPRDMRGFNLEDIGDTYVANSLVGGTPTDFNRGGRSMLLAQFEIERPLIKDAGLKWVTFVDAGNVFKDYIGKDDNYDLRYNWGLGLRWFSPIGILRFEMGFPLNAAEGEKSNQFHFDIGQLF